MATAVVPRVFKNYINGEWSEAASGRAFENRNPANTDELIGIFPDSTAADVDAAVDAARAAFEILAAGSRAQARRNSVPRRGDSLQAQGNAGPRDDSRNGQGPRRDPRRRPGSRGHDLLHGRRGTPPVGSDHAVRTAREICDVGQAAAGRLRPDHPVEFSHGHSVVENHAGADLRKYRGHQARRRYSAFHLQPGADSLRGGLAARRRERGERHRSRSGSAPGTASEN